ncbi:MAG TPA: hypothetical protein VGP70_18570 [Actinomadura sp.]|nr:hypothetical protein [Actinomadura sp.]
MSADDRQSRSSVGTVVPIHSPRPIPPPEITWTDAQWQRIRQGLQADSMEERWIAFVEDTRLFLHRSWTGYGTYEADFQQAGGGWKIVHAVVESDPERYKRSGDEQETTLLECWIQGLLLGEGDPELGNALWPLSSHADGQLMIRHDPGRRPDFPMGNTRVRARIEPKDGQASGKCASTAWTVRCHG